MAAERAPALRSLARMPAARQLTTSGVPQTGVATTGVPQAIASSSTFAQPSLLDASTSASLALYTAGNWSCASWPRKR